MMKKLIYYSILLQILYIASPVLGQNRKVDLKENLPFEEVLKMAKKQKKHIFLDFGSLTCKPCLYIKQNVLTLDSVADYINERFVSVDYNVGAEKDRLRKLYNVEGEPVLLILDQNGKFMHRMAGKMEGDVLMSRFRQGLDLKINMAALDKKYQEGLRDKEFILLYLKTLLGSSEVSRMNKVYHEYTSGSVENLKKQEIFDVFYTYNEDVGSDEVLYLLDNWKEFSTLFGAGKVEGKINKLFSMSSLKYLYGHVNPMSDPTFVRILEFLKHTEYPRASEWLCYLVPAQYKYEDWPKMAEEINNIYKFNILKGNSGRSFKEMMITQFTMYCHDPEALKYGIEWCNELALDADAEEKENFQRTIKTFQERIAKGKPEELEWNDINSDS